MSRTRRHEGSALADWTAVVILSVALWPLARCSKKPATPPPGVGPREYSYTPPPAPQAPTPRPGRPTRTPTIA